MKFEDPELVWTRLGLLALIAIFGITGNVIAIVLNARSYRQSRLNGIAYLHLACVDLLVCCTHVPIGIYLELCGFFSLYNEVTDRFGILWFLNKQISLRVFFVSSFASYVTLGAIAYLRCWMIFNPFKYLGKAKFLGFLLVSDVIVIGINCVTPIPGMSFVLPENNSMVNFTSNRMKISGEIENFTSPNTTVASVRDSMANNNMDSTVGGKTVVGDHGVTVPLLIYTMAVTMLMVTVCYVLICYKLQKAFGELRGEAKNNGTENLAMKAFLIRQVSHVKTHVVLIVTLMVTVMPTVVIAVGGFEISYAMQRMRSTIVIASSAINPYVYCLLKSSNRKMIYQMITCHKVAHKHQSSTSH